MTKASSRALTRVERITESGLSIYDDLSGRHGYSFQDSEIEQLVRERMFGVDLDLPARTRSKVAKSFVAEALGYPVPRSFRKVQPRFPGQDLDIYVQKGNNLQIWNEAISPNRRYCLIRPNPQGLVVDVRVVRGEVIARWDRTGTLTSKYQAKRLPGHSGSRLVSRSDTDPVNALLRRETLLERQDIQRLLPIVDVFSRLRTLEGTALRDPGVVQDRRRGEVAQEAVAEALGIRGYENRGQWPDIVPQLIEVKLQTSPTIDLGLVLPSSEAPAGVRTGLRHCDIRYVVLFGEVVDPGFVAVREIVVSTGVDFFGEFQRFEGQVMNRKLQIPLPAGLFAKSE